MGLEYTREPPPDFLSVVEPRVYSDAELAALPPRWIFMLAIKAGLLDVNWRAGRLLWALWDTLMLERLHCWLFCS